MAAGRGGGHRGVVTLAGPCCLPVPGGSSPRRSLPPGGVFEDVAREGGAARPCGRTAPRRAPGAAGRAASE